MLPGALRSGSSFFFSGFFFPGIVMSLNSLFKICSPMGGFKPIWLHWAQWLQTQLCGSLQRGMVIDGEVVAWSPASLSSHMILQNLRLVLPSPFSLASMSWIWTEWFCLLHLFFTLIHKSIELSYRSQYLLQHVKHLLLTEMTSCRVSLNVVTIVWLPSSCSMQRFRHYSHRRCQSSNRSLLLWPLAPRKV